MVLSLIYHDFRLTSHGIVFFIILILKKYIISRLADRYHTRFPQPEKIIKISPLLAALSFPITRESSKFY